MELFYPLLILAVVVSILSISITQIVLIHRLFPEKRKTRVRIVEKEESKKKEEPNRLPLEYFTPNFGVPLKLQTKEDEEDDITPLGQEEYAKNIN